MQERAKAIIINAIALLVSFVVMVSMLALFTLFMILIDYIKG